MGGNELGVSRQGGCLVLCCSDSEVVDLGEGDGGTVVVSEGKGKVGIQICKRVGWVMVLNVYITPYFMGFGSHGVWVMGYCGCMGY